MGNDVVCEIACIGSPRIHCHDGIIRTLSNIRHVPDMKKNLISLGTPDKLEYKHTGDGGICKVIKRSLVMLKDKMEGGLYVLMGSTILGSIQEWKECDRKIKCLRTDNGLEFCNKEFDNFCKIHGVLRHRTIRHTPQQNGVAERMNRTLLEKARCMLSNAKVPKEFWAEAVNIICYVVNHFPASAIDFKTPKEKVLTTETVEEKVKLTEQEDQVTQEKIKDLELSNYTEATMCGEADQWHLSMTEEMESMHKNQIWNLKMLDTKREWLLRAFFRRRESTTMRFFSPVVKHSSIRLLLDLVAHDDLKLHQLDVKTAFLHGELEEAIFMNRPKVSLLKEKGPSLSIEEIFLCMTEINDLKKLLSKEFEMEDLGEAKKILGMEIHRKNGEVHLSQKEYIEKVVQRSSHQLMRQDGEWQGKVGLLVCTMFPLVSLISYTELAHVVLETLD
ncbi:uncharacterized protein LOC132062049 [Lycium ferocissimum]|uniref:uncharacterized protein LOC132062049 n=1 Tax=Lycium ferocissimum TaxID=112874 RepID=UPI002814FF19|nr:uncharacterized protein LOC132062049 [Lycium ferocissimum]